MTKHFKFMAAILNCHFDPFSVIFMKASIFFRVQHTQNRLKIYAGLLLNYLPLEVISRRTILQSTSNVKSVTTLLDISQYRLPQLLPFVIGHHAVSNYLFDVNKYGHRFESQRRCFIFIVLFLYFSFLFLFIFMHYARVCFLFYFLLLFFRFS